MDRTIEKFYIWREMQRERERRTSKRSIWKTQLKRFIDIGAVILFISSVAAAIYYFIYWTKAQ